MANPTKTAQLDIAEEDGQQKPFNFPKGTLEVIEDELVSLQSQLDSFFKRHQLLLQQLSGVNALPPLSDKAMAVFGADIPENKLDKIYALIYSSSELLSHTRNVMFELESRMYPSTIELNNVDGPRNYIMQLDEAYNATPKKRTNISERELERRG